MKVGLVIAWVGIECVKEGGPFNRGREMGGRLLCGLHARPKGTFNCERGGGK